MRIHLGAAAVAALLCCTPLTAQAQEFSSVCRASVPPVLARYGDRLMVDGKPTFLVLASYFDAMRASRAALESDFAFLRSRGVRGIRIFPLWIRSGQDGTATLLDAAGQVRSGERWQHFVTVLRTAAACGLVVDVTFNRDMLTTMVRRMTVEDYLNGLAEVTARLAADGTHPHVFIDLQNERNRGIPGMDYSAAEIARLRHAIRAADPARLVMCSTLGGVAETLSLVAAADLDVAAFHEAQDEGWFAETPQVVAALRKSGVPIYLQEMGRAPDRGVTCALTPGQPNPFIQALEAAARAGAAAWTFHTAAGFRLDREVFQERMRGCAREQEFLDSLPAALDRLL